MRNLLIAAVGAVTISALAACGDSVFSPNDSEFNRGAGPASASGGDQTVVYSGQGTHLDDNDIRVLGEEICGIESGAEVDGPYLLWIATANGAEAVTITGPWGTEPMEQAGGGNSTWKLVTDYYDLEDLIGNVSASWEGSVNGQVQLVISHGCPDGNGDIGAWCSPGYWGNSASDDAWALTGHDKSDLFNQTVVPNFYATASGENPSLGMVLSTPGANTFGAADDPFGLNAFNAVGAMLTDALDGFYFDPALMGDEYKDVQVCPLNNAGGWDEDFIGWD
jgi:hypothetical protein